MELRHISFPPHGPCGFEATGLSFFSRALSDQRSLKFPEQKENGIATGVVFQHPSNGKHTAMTEPRMCPDLLELRRSP